MRVRLTMAAVVLFASPLCAPAADAALPVETFGCGEDVDHSVRLGDDVGTFASPCMLHGLNIVTKGITVDLGGHTIFGNETDDDSGLIESGLYIEDRSGVRVTNGLVRGFERGVLSGNIFGGTRVDRITAANNGVGIVVTEPKGTVVKSNIAVYNLDDGIRVAADDASISFNVSAGNVEEGISATKDRNVISRNHVARNGGTGIDTDGLDAVVTRNVLGANGRGIDASGVRSRISSNSVIGTTQASADGIHTSAADTTIIGNRSVDNDGNGIFATGDRLVIARNTVASNDGVAGIRVNGDVLLIGGRRSRDGNDVMDNDIGIRVTGGDARILRNRVQGSRQTGILVPAADHLEIDGNRAVGNGLSAGAARGIEVVLVTFTEPGDNFTAANRDGGCSPLDLCHGVTVPATLKDATPSCGTLIAESIRLQDDVGTSGSPCPGNGLEVVADGVVIDLNGHTIWGTTGLTAGFGVEVTGHPDVRVLNGWISGFKSGVEVRFSPRLSVSGVFLTGMDDLAIVSNNSPGTAVSASTAVAGSGNGVFVGERGSLSEVTAAFTSGTGISARGGSRIVRTLSRGNGAQGIAVNGNDVIVDRSVVDDHTFGFGLRALGDDITVRRTIAVHNTDNPAIWASGARTVLASNVASDNDAGIKADGDRALLAGNLAGGNVNAGLLSGRATLRRNTVVGNGTAGIDVDGTGAVLERNRAHGNFTAGIATSGNGHRISTNDARGNGTHGIFVAGADPTTVLLFGNATYGNGHRVSNETGLGISAPSQRGRDNRADANDDPAECEPVTLC